MSRPARSGSPLYVTLGRAYAFPMRLTAPSTGSPIDLTGSTVRARLKVGSRLLDIVSAITAATDGRFRVSGRAETDGPVPEGSGAEIIVTITDTQGGIQDYVYPLIGESL